MPRLFCFGAIVLLTPSYYYFRTDVDNTNIKILFHAELMATNTHGNPHIRINLNGSNYMIPHSKNSASTSLLRAWVSFLFIYYDGDDKWTGTIEPFTVSSTLSCAIFRLVLAIFSLDPKLLISRAQVNLEYAVCAQV